MEVKKSYIFLFSVFFLTGLFSFLQAQENHLSEEKFKKIIQEATLHLYTDPIAVIRIGDSLINISDNKNNEKIIGMLLTSDAFIAIRNYPQALHYMNSAKGLINKNLSAILKIKILNRLAYQHFQLNLYDEALRYLNEADQLNEANSKVDAYLSNKGFTNIVRGLIYRHLVGCDVAMRYFMRSLENYKGSEENIVKMNVSVVYYNIGNCYIAMGEYEKAKENFVLSFHSADIDGDTKNSLKIFAKKGIANYYYLTKQYQTAIDTLESLNNSASKVGDKTLIRSVFSDLASNHLEMGNWVLYEKYTKEYKKINEEIKEAENKATLSILEDINTTHKNSLKKHIKKIQIIIGIISFLFLSFLIPITVSIIKRYRKINIIQSQIFHIKK